jgi:DNA-binding NtrC family response regulator
MNTNPSNPILLVDDEVHALDSLEMALYSHGIDNITTCSDSREVMSLLSQQQIEAVLLDLAMPHVTGEELLPKIKEQYPDIPVIIITGFNDVQKAVNCMETGAYYYLVKPVETEQLVAVVKRSLEARELQRENSLLKNRLLTGTLHHPEAFDEIITSSPSMIGIFSYIEAIATTSQPVIITGETGVGKELIVHSIHHLSESRGELVAVNTAGLDDHMFSDTLFGHEKGAFTGADKARKGLLEKAAGGTLFLDEIGDLSQESQVKLLRLLQEGEYHPLGSDVAHHCTARVIVATSRDIAALRQQGQFRNDFYYRLQTHHVAIPPLRERLNDIPALVDQFLTESAAKLQKKKPTPPDELVTLLQNYDYPGNIRELKSMIFDAVAQHQSKILSLVSFKKYIHNQTKNRMADNSPIASSPLVFPAPLPTIRETTNLLISEALTRSKGNQSLAAGMLGITTQALNQRLKRSKNSQS